MIKYFTLAFFATFCLLLSGCIQPLSGPPTNGSTSVRCGALSEEECIYVKAIEANDVSLCNQLSDEKQFNVCVSSIARDQPNFCDLLKGKGKETCLAHQSIDNSSIEECSQLSSASSRDLCLMSILNKRPSYEVCDAMADQQNIDICIFTVAEAKSDLEACDRIFNQEIKDSCQNLLEESG